MTRFMAELPFAHWTDTPPDAGPRVRAVIHCIAAILTMGIYGGQVCPLVETLDLSAWLIQLGLVFSLFFLLRSLAQRVFIEPAELQNQVGAQFWLELSSFLLTGAVIAGVNQWLHQFPGIDSGLKMVLGTGTLGFFMAADMALTRERLIARTLAAGQGDFKVLSRFFPMTLKFAIVATTASVTVAAVILLVILKDLSWIADSATADHGAARISVIKEIVFVTLIYLAHIFNLIFSYAKNLNLAVKKETSALIRVTDGHLDTQIPVSSHDEFGVMALYTNQMIDMLRKNTREIRETRDATIIALASLAETRDNETGAHILRTQSYVRALAVHLSHHPGFRDFLDQETVHLFYKSAPLHDIGKVGIPDAILLKPGKLTDDEFDIMKQHTILGKAALEKAGANLRANNFLEIAQEIACAHHERWDGSGYPYALSGRDIPVSARLMALADVYDALITKRVYKPAFSHEKAREILIQGRGTHFDPDVLDAFLAIEDQFVAIAEKYADKW